MSQFLGIEIGGSKLQLGFGPGDGTLVTLKRLPVNATAGAERIREQILETVPALLTEAGFRRDDLTGVGIGFGGPVDDATRRVITSHQVSGWDDFPLAEWAEQHLGLPTILGNDADVAGLAEALFGAGRGLSPIFYITIGSGIGGGLIINGEIYRGCGRGAAEIGHLRLEPQRWGDDQTVESVASGWGMAEQARRRLEYTAQSLRAIHKEFRPEHVCRISPVLGGLPDRSSITVPIVFEAAEGGDELARGVRDDAIGALGRAIGQVIALLAPRRVVIGGGVALLGEEQLFAPLRRVVAEEVFRPFADRYDIVPAALGEEVVVHGALALARKRLVSPS